MSDPTPFVYRVYVLRYWRESDSEANEPPARRFSLEDPATGRRYGFTRPTDLVEFLENGLDQGNDSAPATPTNVIDP
jgi:hypothetical protein